MVRYLLFSCLLNIVVASGASAAGPFGTIHVGAWSGGAYTDDKTGAFSHCAAGTDYANGIGLIVGQNANTSWLIGFASHSFHLTPGETFPIDLTFDGQPQARVFGTALSADLVSGIM